MQLVRHPLAEWNVEVFLGEYVGDAADGALDRGRVRRYRLRRGVGA